MKRLLVLAVLVTGTAATSAAQASPPADKGTCVHVNATTVAGRHVTPYEEICLMRP